MQTDQQQLVPVSVAAEQLGITRQSLDGRLRVRGIKPHRIVRAGRVTVLLDQDQIRAAMEPNSSAQLLSLPEQVKDQLIKPEAALLPAEPQAARHDASLIHAEQEAARSQIAQDCARLKAEVQDLEQRAMRAEAMLAAAERIERATALRCDKLEAKLESTAERCAELRADLAAAQTTADHYRTQAAAMIAADSRQLRIASSRRRWWHFGR
jgi:chromosome segregation ATPase